MHEGLSSGKKFKILNSFQKTKQRVKIPSPSSHNSDGSHSSCDENNEDHYTDYDCSYNPKRGSTSFLLLIVDLVVPALTSHSIIPLHTTIENKERIFLNYTS